MLQPIGPGMQNLEPEGSGTLRQRSLTPVFSPEQQGNETRGHNGRHDKQNFEITLVLCDLLTCILCISLPLIQFVWLFISNFDEFFIYSVCRPCKILWLDFDLFTVQVSVKCVTSWEKRYQEVRRCSSVVAHFMPELCDLLTLANICHGNVFIKFELFCNLRFLCECM